MGSCSPIARLIELLSRAVPFGKGGGHFNAVMAMNELGLYQYSIKPATP
jgi:hypothetical protein